MTQNNTQICDLLIVGGGPAGLEAALQAKEFNLDYLLIEKSYIGSLIHDTMAEKKFYHEYGRNTSKLKGSLAFPDRITGSELVKLWQEQAKELRVITDTVQTVTKAGDIFTVKTPANIYQANKVILTSGTFENPRRLHIPGEGENDKVAYATNYYDDYAGKKIIVVGGGNSALETALEYCEQNKIILLVRKDHFTESATEKNQ
ncbi:MAG: NAD(P)/FAD-dependent oxidoreductase, partial [Candidatus Taylorbacteria bacterium]|nr:NAD(P)/FAD-dependent oxidoreductase [Candidatus Taylorbacteria bacterium]